MAFHEQVSWPEDGILMVMPFDPRLHAPGTEAQDGRCHWSDHDAEATWSVVWRGSRWAVCDADLVAFARSEFSPGDM